MARQCALAIAERTITRAESYVAQLVRDLERCAAAHPLKKATTASVVIGANFRASAVEFMRGLAG
jgi:hypothetical protein